MKRTVSFLLVCVMLLTLVLAGCSNSTTPAVEETSAPAETETEATVTTTEDGTIVWGMSTLWSGLMPFNNTNYYNSIVISMLYDQLVYIDVAGEIGPRGADSWSMSEDGKTLTFKLNQNAKFHDGTPVTAADWVWSLQLLTKEGVGFSDQSLMSVFEGTDDAGVETSENSLAVKAEDDYTLSMTFKEVTNMESFLMSNSYFMAVLPSAQLKDIAPADILTCDFWNAPVGSGPAKFVSQSADGTELTLARNDAYHMGDANWNTMIFKQCDASTASSAMLTHEIDIAYSPIANDEALTMDGAEGVTMHMRDEATQVYVIALNNTIMNDARVRQAINYALNKENICTLLTGDSQVSLATPMELYITDSNKYYPQDLTYSQDLEKAKSLLEEAKADGYDGKFVLAAPEAGQRAAIAVLVGQDLEAAGFEVELVTIDASTMMADLKSGAEGTYDGGIIIYGITPDPMSRNDIISASDRTVLSLEDTKYDEMKVAIAGELDETKRAELIGEFYDYLTEQQPAIWMAGKKQYYVYSSKLGNVTDDLIEIARRNVPVWNWKIS